MKVRSYKWHDVLKAGEAGEECYLWSHARSSGGYGHCWVNGRTELVHRLSYEMSVGPIPSGMEIDHACGNRLCITPLHLRPVSKKANQEHRIGLDAKNTSGWRGVSFRKDVGKWKAHVTHDSKQIHVGYFNCPTAAGLAALSKRRELGFLE